MMREFEIERQFQIKIDIIKANKGIYYIKTNKGERCLKKINYGPQKLLFVYGAKEHLIKNGFKNVDKYFLNIDGEPYALVNEDLYTLSEWLEGRECDFHNIEEVKIAAETLAKLHEASKGYDPPENSKLKSDLGRWPSLMEKSSPSSGADFCACGGAGALAGASGMSHVSSAANRIGSGRRARSIRVSRLRSVSHPLPSGSIRPRYARACSPHTASRRRSASAFARAENTVKSPACVTLSVPMGLFCCRIG